MSAWIDSCVVCKAWRPGRGIPGLGPGVEDGIVDGIVDAPEGSERGNGKFIVRSRGRMEVVYDDTVVDDGAALVWLRLIGGAELEGWACGVSAGWDGSTQ